MATKFLEEAITDTIERLAGGSITERLLVTPNADYLKADQVSGANAFCLGVALNSGSAGDSIKIAKGGRIAVTAGGTIAAGDELVSDNAGKAVARGTTATTLYKCFGVALTGAAANELVMVDWGRFTVPGANAS